MDGARPPEAPNERELLLRRRAALAAALTGITVAGAGAAAAVTLLPKGEPRLHSLDDGPPLDDTGVTKVERVYSQARGRKVHLITTLPSADPPPGLPMCLVLHGIHAGAKSTRAYGLGSRLLADVRSGRVAPYGLVAVDGGDNYWQEAHRGDNPMAMLLEEVPGWLRRRGLGGPHGRPFAAAGVSMGGWGTLLYARRRAERREPLDVAAAIAPSLITSWQAMRKRAVFSSPRDWAASDPLRHPEMLSDVRVGVWCGRDDRFIDGVRRFMRLAKPEVAYVGPGGHNGEFVKAVAPDVVRFIGAGLHRV